MDVFFSDPYVRKPYVGSYPRKVFCEIPVFFFQVLRPVNEFFNERIDKELIFPFLKGLVGCSFHPPIDSLTIMTGQPNPLTYPDSETKGLLRRAY